MHFIWRFGDICVSQKKDQTPDIVRLEKIFVIREIVKNARLFLIKELKNVSIPLVDRNFIQKRTELKLNEAVLKMKPSKLPGGMHLLGLHQSFTMEPSRRGSLLQSQILIWTGHLYVWNGMDSTNYKPQTPDKKRQFLTNNLFIFLDI